MGFLCDIAVIGEGATLAHYLRALLPGDAQVHEAKTLDALPRVRVAWVSARALARRGQLLWSLRRFRAGGGLVAFTAAWLATRLSGACATTATLQAHRLAAHVLQRPGARVALPGLGQPAPVGQHLVGVV